MSITPMSPDQAARRKVRTWVTSQWKLCASRVSSQWKSTSSALAEIARLLKVENFAPDTAIVRAGQPGDSMYFIAEGEVAVLVGDQRIPLKAGQFFGEAALIASTPRNATVVAAGRARLLRLDVVEFRDLASRLPELLAIIHSEDSRRKPDED